MKIEDIANIIDELNDEFYDSLPNNTFIPFIPYKLNYYGWQMCGVEYMGEYIWSEEDDNREFNEETQEYEPLKDYLLKKTLEIQKVLFPTVGIIKDIQHEEYPKVMIDTSTLTKVVLFTRENHGIIVDHNEGNIRGFEKDFDEGDFIPIEDILDRCSDDIANRFFNENGNLK